MTTEHPITPPPELVYEWFEQWDAISLDQISLPSYIAFRTAQWVADRELDACCEWVANTFSTGESEKLRSTRRPKPPSLKEEALEALEQIDGYAIDQLSAYTIHKELKQYANTIRRAIEALPND